MKHYVLFINGRCFVEFRYKHKTVRKALDIMITDKQKQVKIRRYLHSLIIKEQLNEHSLLHGLTRVHLTNIIS